MAYPKSPPAFTLRRLEALEDMEEWHGRGGVGRGLLREALGNIRGTHVQLWAYVG